MTADEAPERSTKLLQIAGTVEAAGEPLDVEDLVRELGGSAPSVRAEIEQLDGQRIESWFKPFGRTIPTGYIGE
jgi:hypothetical protein